MINRILFTLFTLFIFHPLYAQTIDDSSCWEYFMITEDLKKDQPLDRERWNNFLQNEAIQVYLKDQGVDSTYVENYRKSMEIVYMPKNSHVLQEKLKDQNKNWWTYIVNEYKLNEDNMKKYLTQLKIDQKKYFDTCYQYSYGMLPKKNHKKAPEYRISIIPVHNDAHVENGWMVFTLMAAYFSDHNKNGTLGGHEFHHVLRPRLVFEVDEEDKVIVSLLQRILNEGSADLIDKRYEGEDALKLLEFQRGYPESFIAEGPKTLKNIDSLLSVKPLNRSQLKINQLIDSWNTSGHIPGYYMANIIETGGYKKQLIEHIEDPFQFIYLYHDAAKKNKDAYMLSSATMEVIRGLDKKYRSKARVVQHD